MRCYSSPILPLFNMQQRKQKKILRINSLKLLHLDSRNDQIIQESLEQVLIFTDGLQLSYGLTSNDILLALQATHTAADEYLSWDGVEHRFCHPRRSIRICLGSVTTICKDVYKQIDYQKSVLSPSSMSHRYIKLQHTMNKLLYK